MSTLRLRAGRRTVEIEHADNALYPEDGITEGDVARYYVAVAPVMLAYLRDRPLVMERFPRGIRARGFLQKQVPTGPRHSHTLPTKRAWSYMPGSARSTVPTTRIR